MNDILKDAEKRMKSAVEVMVHDFGHIRTGRANPMVLEPIKVPYYGVETPINQVANISIPEPRMLVITPYEKNMLAPIERAIQKSDLGVNPNSDGICVRLAFPPMTEERRKVLAKQVAQRAEEGRVAIRNVRRDAHHHGEAKEKAKEMSEDDLKTLKSKIQELTDKYIAEVEKNAKKKETELMEV